MRGPGAQRQQGSDNDQPTDVSSSQRRRSAMLKGKGSTSPCRLQRVLYVVPTEKILKPGETVTLYKPEVAVEGFLEGKADATTNVQTPTILGAAGEVQVSGSAVWCKAIRRFRRAVWSLR